MTKLKKRVLWIILGGILTPGILLVVGRTFVRTPAAMAYTGAQLLCYQMASTNFFGRVGRWPTSETELVTNSLGLIFILPPIPARDGWGRPIVYEPYSTNARHGRVISYGRDGKPGGTDADADAELMFP